MNWTVIKALNKIYNNGSVKRNKTLNNSAVLKNHEQANEIRIERKDFVAIEDFNAVYESKYLEDFNRYVAFLSDKKFLKPQLKFDDSDIEVLIMLDEKIKKNTLVPSIKQLKEAQETVRGFSDMFFKNEKYLDKKDSLINAINQILGIELIENKDQQYLYVLQCKKPKLIILCENFDFLRKDKLPRANHYELWYAGGKNVPKLKYSNEIRRGLPIYYSADWDKDGLEIFELVKEIIPDIQLLYPTTKSRSIEETEHKSHWKTPENPELLSGLNKEYYSLKYQNKIKELIQKDHWIVEERNDLKVMIEDITKSKKIN